MLLYKYYPDNSHSFKSLAMHGLWCHFSNQMNDPFECLALADRDFSTQELETFKKYVNSSESHVLKKIQKFDNKTTVDYLNQNRKELIKRFAFCSLSESFDKIIMWSIYASNHTGFVIGFDFPEMNNDYHFQKIRYLNTLISFDSIRLLKQLEGDFSNLNYLLKDISVKSKDWKHEREWRIWRKEPCYYHYDISSIKEIYFGVNCSIDTKKTVIKLLTKLDDSCALYEMEFKDKPIRLEK